MRGPTPRGAYKVVCDHGYRYKWSLLPGREGITCILLAHTLFINKAEFLSFYSGMDGLGEIPL